MAARRSRNGAVPDPRSRHARALVRELLLGARGERFTQDSPVLPDVWLAFAECPDRPIELLLTAHHGASSGELAAALRRHVAEFRKKLPAGARAGRSRHRLAHSQSIVRAELYFDDVVCVVLPMTPWFKTYISDRSMLASLDSKQGRDHLKRQIEAWEAGESTEHPDELLWMARIVGAVAWVQSQLRRDGRTLRKPSTAQLIASLRRIAARIEPLEEEPQRVWLVSKDRAVHRTVYRSALTIKADAGRRLFDIDCSDLRWAVVDTGIDALHPAFVDRKELERRLEESGSRDPRSTLGSDGRLADLSLSRVKRTYDFTFIARLLDPDTPDEELPAAFVESLSGRGNAARRRFRTTLKRALAAGRDLDWKLIDDLLLLEGDRYRAPIDDHGTHVAGILGADSLPLEPSDLGDGGNSARKSLVGVCPDIQLYDIRVFPEPDPDDPDPDNNPDGDEFGLIAALQFVRYLNAQHDFRVLHGLNLSLAVPHNVQNYACGRTPICDEANRTAASGVVVVAAAGNQGFLPDDPDDPVFGSYADTSITDPGNAEAVITVGSAHRQKPHIYGISYFSSRGPTGDGRLKPDLVAPGEKIKSTSLFAGDARKEGTSMSAPHVSGAAAMLMARHPEVIGDAARIKEVLCKTATDLGRERYFQGAGMVDVLRALQSV